MLIGYVGAYRIYWCYCSAYWVGKFPIMALSLCVQTLILLGLETLGAGNLYTCSKIRKHYTFPVFWEHYFLLKSYRMDLIEFHHRGLSYGQVCYDLMVLTMDLNASSSFSDAYHVCEYVGPSANLGSF